jgi:lipopolysaccharide/colanic/teichoic acid biosynthesis glycosyltransferase
VQVARQGEALEIVEHADLFLLTDPRLLTIFNLADVLETLNWVKPRLMCLRLHDLEEHGYREKVITCEPDRFVRFQRIYGRADSRLARVVITSDHEVVQAWLSAPNPRDAWRNIRGAISPMHRATLSIGGHVYDRTVDHEVVQFTRDLVQTWTSPDVTISRATRVSHGVWCDVESKIASDTMIVGPIWIGVARSVAGESSVVGPAVLWDDPAFRPALDQVQWQEIEPQAQLDRPVVPRQLTSFNKFSKRVFDVAASLLILLMTLPIYPLVMLAIWLEDGWPFFFAHRRESIGGKPFPCLKFRSMRKDAEKIKAELATKNQADGPQFFIEQDPRLTRVGKIVRATNIDELPQLFNVLAGHMSIVGPRPSPFEENQFCPPWREARLSVKPGITGLWQVRRSRIQGLDFQEWIKYDLQYVENTGWRMDLMILWETFLMLVRGILHL